MEFRVKLPTVQLQCAMQDRSFGFDTAMQLESTCGKSANRLLVWTQPIPSWCHRSEALKAIEVAYVEATCNANCIGLVKLMGR